MTECYICLDDKLQQDLIQPCNEVHLVCDDCYTKLENKTVCAMCKQINPLYIHKKIILMQPDQFELYHVVAIDVSDDEPELIDANEQLFDYIQTPENIQEEITLIQQRLSALFQESEYQNNGNPNEWRD